MSATVFAAHEAERDRQMVQFPGSIVIGSFKTIAEGERAKGKKPGKDYILTVIPFPDLSHLYLWTPWRHYPPRSAGSHENQINVVGGAVYWLDCPVSADDQLRHTDEEMKAQRERLEAAKVAA